MLCWKKERAVRVRSEFSQYQTYQARCAGGLTVKVERGAGLDLDWIAQAKLYKKPVDKQTYYDDVLLQMDSKRLADAFNLMDPPKKVDFLQT